MDGTSMRPQVDDTTAEVIGELADSVTEIDVEMLTFDQQLRVVLKNIDNIELKGVGSGLTTEGQVVARL